MRKEGRKERGKYQWQHKIWKFVSRLEHFSTSIQFHVMSCEDEMGKNKFSFHLNNKRGKDVEDELEMIYGTSWLDSR